jgi:hypothetical protein
MSAANFRWHLCQSFGNDPIRLSLATCLPLLFGRIVQFHFDVEPFMPAEDR